MKLQLKAPAKINLGLSILGKLVNNYHEVRIVYTQISLFDLIEIEEIRGGKIEIKCDKEEISSDENNLVWQAVELIKQQSGIKKGVKIKLKKQIPVGSGLGGGSADAAVILKGLNKLWKLNLSLEKLIELGKKIGADVAYQLIGGVKLEVQGGDKAGEFEDLGKLPESYFVVVVPKKKRSSQQAYQEVDYGLAGKNSLDGLVEAIKKKDLDLIGGSLHNDFELWSLEKFPEVREIEKVMKAGGAVGSLMSGKGLAVFGLFKDKKMAKEMYNSLKQKEERVYLVRPFYD